jgi:hypothetical protein
MTANPTNIILFKGSEWLPKIADLAAQIRQTGKLPEIDLAKLKQGQLAMVAARLAGGSITR